MRGNGGDDGDEDGDTGEDVDKVRGWRGRRRTFMLPRQSQAPTNFQVLIESQVGSCRRLLALQPCPGIPSHAKGTSGFIRSSANDATLVFLATLLFARPATLESESGGRGAPSPSQSDIISISLKRPLPALYNSITLQLYNSTTLQLHNSRYLFATASIASIPTLFSLHQRTRDTFTVVMLTSAVVAFALLASAVSAQTNASYVDPNTVDGNLKASWCNGQQHVCLTLCSQAVNKNKCDPPTLTYDCLCASNNSAPDLKDYMNSMPYFICEKSYDLCIAAHPNDQSGQDSCKSNIRSQCGTLDIANFTAAATTTSAVASATSAPASATDTASGTAASASPTKSSAAVAAVTVGRDYGSSIIAALFVAAFGFMV